MAATLIKFKRHALAQRDYSGTEDNGDIDLFLFDRKTKVGFVVQMKWLLIDRIKSTPVEETRDAFDQAKRAIKWIRSDPQRAAAVLKLSKEELESATIHPLAVMCWVCLVCVVTDPEVPILSGAMFDTLIKVTRGNPVKLCQLISSKQFLPEEGRDFIKLNGFAPADEKPFNGVLFRKHQLNLPPHGKCWNPNTDIRLP